eukprot:XP_001691508.1 predicted protein [Chlamydomonas reinhardtii]
MDTLLHACCRYTLLRVLRWLLPQLDAAALAARTKAHWGPLHTAARAPHRQLAVEVTELLLRRGEQLGLFTEEAMQQRGTSALLSDLSFNKFYLGMKARSVLDEAVWRKPRRRVSRHHEARQCPLAQPQQLLAPGNKRWSPAPW